MNDIVPARPSATVVVAREGESQPELFMVHRHPTLSFGAAYAFPGGVVDDDDAAVHDFCTGVSTDQANSRLGVKANGLESYSAAIRELFEESGILLASSDDLDEDLNVVRNGLNDGSENWSAFVKRDRLQLHCDQLHYISHWLTPATLPERYSTRFFLAELPDRQSARHCGGELTDSRWATAHDMLEAGRTGELDLHFPTIKTLESIARHKSLEALLEWARSCVEWGVTSMVPAIITRDGAEEIVLPGDKDYPGAKS
ncbi:MAG: NUDIX domain-containing protein [Gammaproteobacteria bacterium]|nr:NUDIX domain-containing protein [Gammaproteobacteria bacterium]